jgi:DNA primase
MARYSDEVLDEVRQSNDIVSIVSQYVALKRKGKTYWGLCPFHNEKTPSFAVSSDKQIYHCFGCGVGGNVFTFITKMDGISFTEAVELLADKANIVLPKSVTFVDDKKEKLKAKIYEINEFAAKYYQENLLKPTAKAGQDYIKKRRLNNQTLQNFRIGFSGKFDELYKKLKANGYSELEMLESGLVRKSENGIFMDTYRNRLMFPICDVRDRVIAFGGRVLDDSKPKYINSAENVIYNKSRNLFGLNLAKKGDTKKMLVVEGYMDVISLHQRGITNVVAPLGTALTEQQGWLLRKITDQIILSFDSDGAGQNAISRSIEIMQNMGIDTRILQMEGAKDPDEYIIKFGELRFKNVIDNAISVLEFRVKNLKNVLNLENTNDKIKFLNEIAKLISKVDNRVEREVYIEKISKEYDISKEAIFAEVNKLSYSGVKAEKALSKPKQVLMHKEPEKKVDENIIKRENTIVALLLNFGLRAYNKIKNVIKPEDLKSEENKIIMKKLYEEFEKANDNVNALLYDFEENLQNHITMIMAYDFEIEDIDKAIEDILTAYRKEKLNERKLEIIAKIETEENIEAKKELEKELSSIINNLVKMK